MSATIFTGPIGAGNVLQSDGTGTLAGLGGSSGTQNVGLCEMVQTSAIVQATASAAMSVVIPAASMITGIDVYVTTAFTNSATLSVGTTSANANELATGVTVSSVGKVSITPTTLVPAWVNTSATQDVQIFVKSSAAPSGGTGAAVLVVKYAQSINAYPTDQYT
jgi:hypothetical protein